MLVLLGFLLAHARSAGAYFPSVRRCAMTAARHRAAVVGVHDHDGTAEAHAQNSVARRRGKVIGQKRTE